MFCSIGKRIQVVFVSATGGVNQCRLENWKGRDVNTELRVQLGVGSSPGCPWDLSELKVFLLPSSKAAVCLVTEF